MRITLAILITIFLATTFAAASQSIPPPRRPAIDTLFAQLAKADSPENAKPIENQIFEIFLRSGSPSIDLLMTRTSAALAVADKETAKKLIAAIIDIAPDFAEGWHQQALVQLADGDDEGGMVSLQKTVGLNPRHFAAMSQLGDLLEEYGDKPGALKMYKKALSLDPQLEGVARHVRALSRAVEGQGI